MDKFVTKTKITKTPKNPYTKNAKYRALQFPGDFHEDSGHLFCSTCFEFNMYVNVIAPEFVQNSTDVCDLNLFWLANKERLPVMSEIALIMSMLLADAERANSMYNCILTDQRRSMAEKTIKRNVFLKYNLNLI